MLEVIYINKVKDASRKDGFRYEYWGVEGFEYVCELNVLRQKRDKDGNWTFAVSLKKLGLENKDYLSTKSIIEGLNKYEFVERDIDKKTHYQANNSKKYIDKMSINEKLEYECASVSLVTDAPVKLNFVPFASHPVP